jgi:methylmalonyl-CoA mutase N-terminal domain/subunit
VNRFLEGNNESDLEILRITNEDETKQRQRLATVKQDRDENAVIDALDRLAKDAVDPEVNLMPALVGASQVYATVGEMMNTMAGVFGRHVEVPTI